MYLNDVNVNKLIIDHGISATAARLFFEINRLVNASRNRGFKDRKGVAYCYASKERLAEKIDRTPRTVYRCLKELKAAGMIQGQRTTRNGHLYIACYDVISGSDANVISNNRAEKVLTNIDTSINPISAEQSSVDLIKNSQDKPAAQTQPARQRTRKPKIRITKHDKAKARERYYEMIANKLGLSNSDWWQFPDEHDRMKALASIIADALSVPSRQIRINGRNVTVGEYWNTIKDLTLQTVADIPDRIESYRLSSGIRNINAYVLACVFNECQFQNLIKGASPSIA